MKELFEKNNITLYSTDNEENLLYVKDGNEQLKSKCGSSLLSRVIQYNWTYYQKYWSSIITPNTVPLK